MGLFDRFLKRKTEEATDLEPKIQATDESSKELKTKTSRKKTPANKPAAAAAKKVENSKKTKSKKIDSAKLVEEQQVQDIVYDQGMQRTRNGFSDRFNKLLANFRTVDEEFFEQLEETLISADVGFEIALNISDRLRDEVKLQNAKSKEDVKTVITEALVDSYENAGGDTDAQMNFAKSGPTVFLLVGVNGVGKTTTIGKLASLYKAKGKKVLLAAADTFRAGAVKQLQEWGQRDDVDVISGKEKSDPSSVVFDAVQRAVTEEYDLLIVDTAGRLQNNVNLMQELAKMKKIIERQIPDAPQEVLLVLDATTGQNALQQARLFKDSSDVTGIVLTKIDGTAKGGIVLAIRQEMKIPVKWLGMGEKVDDLQFFDSEEFIYNMFKDLIDIK